MATKRSSIELFERYHQTLIFSLPMKNAKFLGKLYENDLVFEDLNLESLGTCNERASYFLDKIIKPTLEDCDNANFVKLLSVMKNSSYDHVKQIKKEFHIDAKCKLRTYICAYMCNFFTFYMCSTDKSALPDEYARCSRVSVYIRIKESILVCVVINMLHF